MAAPVVNTQHTVNIDSRKNVVLQSLNKERKENGCPSCEVILLTNGIRHFAHKKVLVSNSDFFRQYFERKRESSRISYVQTKIKSKQVNEENATSSEYESSEDSEYNVNQLDHETRTTIFLPGIKPDELSRILEYMYTSNLTLTAKNVNEILLAACLLQITGVIEFCAEVLIKRPGWRSPLVSPKLLNFVKNKNSPTTENKINFHGNSSTSSTAVTKAVQGARATFFESATEQPQSNGRFVSSNTSINHKTAAKIRQRQQPTRNLSDFLKRRHQFFSSERNITKPRLRDDEHKSAYEYNLCNTGKDIAIDSEELRRELVESYRLKNQNNDAMSFIRHSYIADSNTIQRFGDEYSNQHQQNQLYLKSDANIVSNLALSDNQLLSTFPQINEHIHGLTSAYAPAFRIPILPPEYFGFPIIEPTVSPLLRNTVMKTGSKMQNQGFAMKRDPSKLIPINRYSGSVATILVPPEKVHVEVPYPSTQRFRPNSLIHERNAYPGRPNLITHKNSYIGYSSVPPRSMKHTISDVERACAKSLIDLTSRASVKKFCPSIVPRLSVSEANNFGSGDLNHRNMQQKDTVTHTNIFKSRFESEPQVATCAASPTTKNKVDIKANLTPDYPTRKRKLLASQSLVANQNNHGGLECKTPKIEDFFDLKEKINKKSTEDDMIPRKSYQSKICYPESDDSGRPSSV